MDDTISREFADADHANYACTSNTRQNNLLPDMQGTGDDPQLHAGRRAALPTLHASDQVLSAMSLAQNLHFPPGAG
ncbi:hypothetical protein IAQ61_006671 [Plenodomus lingam]|uniref:uncharacterized protein n=1 Tax=Leptosphaeria maculans TaxID=5022 RepID=UPI00332EE456|nr:hypothetical protein IAQ61_006671 [Plenodomus lingam]